MKVKKSNLYEIIWSICNHEYVLGLHGTFNAKKSTLEDSLERADHIMSKGLQNQDSNFKPRNIHRTVKFLGNIDDQRNVQQIKYHLQTYQWMEGSVTLIIAIPRIFRNSQNNNIFLGIPNHDLIIYAEDTSFLDKVTYGSVPNFFVLGYYYSMDDIFCDLILNPYHVAFINHFVPDQYYDEIKSKLTKLLDKNNCPILSLNMSQKEILQVKSYLQKVGSFSHVSNKYQEQLWIIETIQQYFDEENKIAPFPSKFTQEQILKILDNKKTSYLRIRTL